MSKVDDMQELIDDLETVRNELDGILSSEKLDVLTNVIDEWNIYTGEEMESMQDEIDEKDQKISDLQDTILLLGDKNRCQHWEQ